MAPYNSPIGAPVVRAEGPDNTGVYNLALQWDQHRVLVSQAEGVRVGPKVKVATHRLDSLTALRADERCWR